MNLKKANEYMPLALVILAILFALLAYFKFKKSKEPLPPPGFTRKRGGACPGEVKFITMEDPYMRGLIEKGQKLKLTLNYYDCNSVKPNDFVYYQFSTALVPVVKVARGVAGDKFDLKPDPKRKAWNLFINGEPIHSELPKHENYFFGSETPPTLSLYSKSRGGIVGPDEVILLSSYPPGDADSGTVGIVKLIDVMGKIEIVKETK